MNIGQTVAMKGGATTGRVVAIGGTAGMATACVEWDDNVTTGWVFQSQLRVVD